MKKLTGVIPACLTPFDKDENVNLDAIPLLVDKFVSDGMSGLYMTGSTGEFPLLTVEEREAITKTVCEAAKGKLPVISHVGASSLKDTLRLAECAAKYGADAVSSVAPFYYSYSYPEVKTFYSELAAVGLPVIIYNIPQRTGVAMTVDQILELAEIPNIVGVKHTAPDMFFLEQMKTRRPDFNVISGPDEMFLSAVVMGADACIGSTYNFQGRGHVKIYQAFQKGDMAEALKWQKQANATIAALIKVGVMQGCKYFIAKQGVDCGECRSPMRKLTDADKKYLDMVYEQYEF